MQIVISAVEPGQTAHVVSRLVAAGFAREDVHIQRAGDLFGAPDPADLSHTVISRPDDEHRGLLASIGHFVTSLFGLDTPATVSYTYTEALQRGGSVLLVDVADDVQCERAIGILRKLGATAVRVIEPLPEAPLRDAITRPAAGLTGQS